MTTDGMEVATRVEGLLSEPIAHIGCRLLEVQFRSEGKWVLRLIVDREPSIGIKDIGAISELAGRLLDVEDPIPQAYSLEVTSPGLYRILSAPRHFEQCLGKMVRLTIAEGFLPDRRKRTLRGRIEKATEQELILVLQDETVNVPMEAIRAAKLDPDL